MATRLRRLLHAIRLEAALAAAAYAALLVFAHPGAAAELLRLPEFPWEVRLFYGGLATALAALGCLALRLWGRLFALGRRRPDPAAPPRAVAGTVMVEFALVFPLVLLVMSIIVQLALIANASLVVRYAAFASARSAIVNLSSYPLINMPPGPEPPVKDNPELAARLVLASISPKTGAAGNAEFEAMERVLRDQPGSVWHGRDFASRMEYATAGTRVTTLYDRLGPLAAYHASLPGLVPKKEHFIPPAGDDYYLPLLQASAVLDAIGVPPVISVDIPITVTVQVSPLPPIRITFTITVRSDMIPGDPYKNLVYDPMTGLIQSGLGWLSANSPALLYAFADTPANRDPLGPKQVAIEVEYDFLLTLPSLHFIPGLGLGNEKLLHDPPVGRGGKVFRIRHTVWLQSTGGRQASLLALLPVQDNWPIWWKK